MCLNTYHEIAIKWFSYLNIKEQSEQAKWNATSKQNRGKKKIKGGVLENKKAFRRNNTYQWEEEWEIHSRLLEKT